MKQIIKAGRTILSAAVIVSYPITLQAGAIQQGVFNTAQGFLPSDYMQDYPLEPTKCRSAGAVVQVGKGFESSGSALETFGDGLAVIYQAMFAPHMTLGSATEGVVWAGDLRALLIDEHGRWRSDNGDKRLGSIQEDPLVASCLDASAGLRRFSVSQTTKPKYSSKCNALNFPFLEHELGYLWRADEVMARMSQQDALYQRHPFQSKASQRFIRTHIGQQEYDFVGTADYPFEPAWFGFQSMEKAQQVINFIRGREHPDWRNRYLDQQIYRLGDTLNATPAQVGRPVANFHLLYGDTSYQMFLNQYRNRRSRIFLSSHDGMLHAFNAGWYDQGSKEVLSRPAFSSGLTEWELGQEMWAFVPFDILPMLPLYADKQYGRQGLTHVNLLSQTPYIFDAKIFSHQGTAGIVGQADRRFESADGSVVGHDTHPGGWGTILVTGFGSGGGAFATQEAHGTIQYFQPAYLVFDITDAEQAPKLLAYLRPQSLGSSFAQPSVITRKNQLGELQWYLALGSGTDLDPSSMQTQRSRQNAKVFLYNLHDIDNEARTGGNEIDLSLQDTYVAGMSAADWDLDGASDALYISATGTLAKSPSNQWQSALIRLSESRGRWHPQKLLKLNAALSFRPQLSIDASKNRWVYLATGRAGSGAVNSSSNRNSILGIKEARDASGHFHMDADAGKSRALDISDLFSVGSIRVNPVNGELLGSVRITPALSRNTVLELEQRLQQYTPASAYLPGWHRALDYGEAASSPSSLYGGYLTQATNKRSSGVAGCTGESKNYLHQLRFTTGTAWFDEHYVPLLLSQTESSRRNTSKPIGSLTNTRIEMPSNGTLTDFLIQVVEGEKQANILLADPDGGVYVHELSLVNHLVSGEVSWREL